MNQEQQALVKNLLERWRKISPECMARQPAEVQEFYNTQIKPLLAEASV